jgi:hypothetical protein
MYEPYEFTSAPNARRKVPYEYPGMVTFGGKQVKWDAAAIDRWMSAPFVWAKQHGVPANRVVAGEFGCVRTLQGCKQWLSDVLTVLDKHNAHWAFYSFREDAWDAMDYELGKNRFRGPTGKPSTITPLIRLNATPLRSLNLSAGV